MSSEPRSVSSSLEKFNLLESSDEEPGASYRNPVLSDKETVHLTPVTQRIFGGNAFQTQLPTLRSVFQYYHQAHLLHRKQGLSEKLSPHHNHFAL